MSESESKSECPKCGAELPAGAPRGLCPRCLMAGAMEPTGPAAAGENPEPPSIEEVQAAFPQLEIIDLIGAGGMGVVFRAKQTSLNREVALKLLAPHREQEPGFAERFTREAQALAAMNHPNIVTVHDFGQAGGFFFLLMEFVDGVNLREAMRAGKFAPKEALAIVPPICEALQYAHDQGVVHRDIKPENLLLDKSGTVKVADFGIARILNLKEPDSAAAEIPESSLTAGSALGTPKYMAPEQADAPENVDHRADIYSLGVVLYEMLTGEPPRGPLTPPSTRVKIDVRLDEIVLRALDRSPELRWQSATELQTQIETVVSTKAETAPPPSSAPPADSKTMPYLVWFTALAVPAALLMLAAFTWLSPGLNSLALLVGAVAVLAFWLRGAAKPRNPGCQAIFLTLALIGSGVLLTTSLFDEFPSRGQQANRGPRVVFDDFRADAPPNQHPELEFRFEFRDLPHGWDPWVVVREFGADENGREKFHGASSTKVDYPNNSLRLPLPGAVWNDAVEEIARQDFRKRRTIPQSVKPGVSARVVAFADARGERYTIDFELRPSPAATSGPPGDLIFLREVRALPEAGSLELAWNHVQSLGGYELFLETNAALQVSPHDQIEVAGFDSAAYRNRMVFSRVKIDGGGSLRFDFPPMRSLREDHRVIPPVSQLDIARDRSATLFDLTDEHTNHRAWAELKLVPAGALQEVAAAPAAAGVEPPPGSPLPPPPDGALWVAERRISIPGEFVIKVNIEESERDGPFEAVQEPLIVKLPVDDSRGIALRWRVYPADHPELPNGYLVDLIAGGSGAIFHRFEGRFEQPVETTSSHVAPFPNRAELRQLVNLNNIHYYGLIRATEPVPEGAGVTQWWEIRASIVALLKPTGENSPAYQLPPSGHLRSPLER